MTYAEQLQNNYRDVRRRLMGAPPSVVKVPISVRPSPIQVEQKPSLPSHEEMQAALSECPGWVPTAVELLETLLAIRLERARSEIRVSTIIKAVALYYDMTPNDIRSNVREMRLVNPRHIAAYLARTLTTKSLPEIGRALGGRDHTSILHAIRRITGLIPGNPQLAHDIAYLERIIQEGA